MTFGRPTGPPASRRQVEELLVLLQRAGHADFRDARGPMGFTQRQAGGRFTRDEAEAFIDRLTAELDGGPDTPGTGASTPTPSSGRDRATAAERTIARQVAQVRAIPSEVLAAELQRRGWAVIEP